MRETVILWYFNKLQYILDWQISFCFVLRQSLTIEKEEFLPSRVHTLQECSLSALLVGGLLHGICLRKTEECDIRSHYTHTYIKRQFRLFKPCSALVWTASVICFVISKRVSFDAATSSPRITCIKRMKDNCQHGIITQ